MSNPIIRELHAREVLDSRGRPTVEAEILTADRYLARAIAPSGASTGKHEALELRDGDPKRYRGRGVLHAVRNVNEIIAPKLIGTPLADVDAMLIALDGTSNKSHLGANAMLAVSLAAAHASAMCEEIPLWMHLAIRRAPKMPMPMVNMISGGLHAGGNLELQDFLFVPIHATTYSEALMQTVEVYQCLGELLRDAGYEGTLVGDEGGFGPRLRTNEEALEFLVRAYHKAGIKAGIALDVASTHFYRDGLYRLESRSLTSGDMIQTLRRWVDAYPIVSIEDGLAEDDWDGWRELTSELGGCVQLIGDDLFVTNVDRVAHGIANRVANSVLVKLNQIGTLSETLAVIEQAKANGYRTVVSARSGETEDTTMADLAVGTGAGQIKIGSIVRSERLAKYNQLLRIEEHLSGPEHFAGW